MKIPLPSLTVLILVVGCSRDAAIGPNEAALAFSVAGASGCHTVSGEIAQSGLAPSFAGTISGDIEGSVSTQLDPTDARVAGRVSFPTAEQTWEVTGGTVPDLIGRTVHLALETEIVFAQPPIARNNTTARVIDGAEAGNLTYHGTLNASPPPPFAVDVEYSGVICP
jgi:hypothetical protein